jgi:hypothetical protein
MNAVTNGGFDSNLQGWQWGILGQDPIWSNDDAVSCPTSGSMRVRTKETSTFTASIDTCAVVSPSATYDIGLRARKLGTATGQIQFEVRAGSSATCTGGGPGFYAGPFDVGTDWAVIAGPSAIPNASSLFVVIYFRKTDSGPDPLDVEVDMAYVTPTGSVGWQ